MTSRNDALCRLETVQRDEVQTRGWPETMIQGALHWLLFKDRYRQFHERLDFLRATPSLDIPALQRDRFNEVWAHARKRYRFYADWQRRHGLPDRIEAIDDLRDFPLLRKTDLQEHALSIEREARPCSFTVTGGSTGTPVKSPVTRGDRDVWYVNGLVGRSRAGIPPNHPVVMIWGHSHLHGHGFKRHVRVLRKRLVDYVNNVERHSAYYLDEASLARCAESIRALRPVVYAYPSAMRKFLDHLEEHDPNGRIEAKTVILAAEVARERDRARIRRLLKAPTVIEYGMAETGPVGFSTPDSGRVTMLWDAVYCHALPPLGELVLSTLQPRRFPYINYATGDLVEGIEVDEATLFSCARIIGRTTDVLRLTRRDGSTFEASGISMTDVIDAIEGVQSYFIHQKGSTITFKVKTKQPSDFEALHRQMLAELESMLPGVDPQTIAVEPLTEDPLYTPAGKTRYVVRD